MSLSACMYERERERGLTRITVRSSAWGERRGGVVFFYETPFKYLSLSCVLSVSLPISCTYSTHPQTQGCMKDTLIPPSVLLPLSKLIHVSLCFFLCLSLSHTHTPLSVFLINFAVNLITPLCNKLQSPGIEKGKPGWRWKRRKAGCSNIGMERSDLWLDDRLFWNGTWEIIKLYKCEDVRMSNNCIHAGTCTVQRHTAIIPKLLDAYSHFIDQAANATQSTENHAKSQWHFDALICSLSEQEIIVG